MSALLKTKFVALLVVVGGILLLTGVTPPVSLAEQDGDANLASFQSFNHREYFIRHRQLLGEISEIKEEIDRQDATFKVVAGLADKDHVSLQSINLPKHFVRHHALRIKVSELEDTDVFRKDATFKRVKGLAKDTWISFESVNFPGHYIRHKNLELWLEKNDNTALFAEDATFFPEKPFHKP